VNETTGNITFQSPPYWRGEENITITAFDYDSNATSNTFTLLVNTSGYPPNISLIGNQNAAIGAPFLLYIMVEDPDLLYGDNITYTDNSTLFNIEWHNITGNVSYGKIEFTPTAGQEGLYTILVGVEDLYSFTDNQTFTLNISPNNPPELYPIGNQNSTQDILFNLTLSAFDLDDDELLFFTNSSLFGLPLNNTTSLYQLNSINSTHAFFDFIPTNEQVGNYTVRFYVYDGIGAIDYEIITFQVININDEPSFIPPLLTDLYTKINQTFIYYANTTDPDLIHGDILTFATNDSILNITKISNEQLLINITPEQSDEGIRIVRVNVTDIEGLYDEWIFNLHILPPIAPVLDAIINISATENEQFISLITATDANDDPLLFSFNNTIWSDYVQTINDTAVLINTTYIKSQVGIYSINVTVTDPDGLSDSTTIAFEVIETDNPPEIEHPGNLLFYEGVLNSVMLNVTDLEGDNWTITTNLSDILTIAQINLTNANLTSTPNTSQIGNHKVLFTVSQDSNPTLNTSIIVDLTIIHNPSPPVIESFNPSPPTSIIIYEGTPLEFNATITDTDFDIYENITARWYFKGELMHTDYIESNNLTISYNFTPGYCDAGDYSLYLNLTDYYSFTTSMSWTLDIQNVNRPPEFGVRRLTAEFLSDGTLEDLDYSDGKIFLEVPLSSGNLTSSVIDFGSSFNRANLNIIYGNIEAEGVNISGANITYSIRTGSGSNPNLWDMSWTDYQQVGTQIILPENLTPKRYAQLRIRINDSEGDYPEIEQILWKYSFGNQTLESSSVYSNWVSLSDFFFDPDDECPTPDSKIPAAEGNIITDVDIDDSDDMTVTLLTEQNTGTEIWWFRFSDGEATVESNNITFTIIESEIPPITIPVSSGGGGSSTTTITVPMPFPVEIEDPIPIDLIVPESVTIYDNDTIVVPVTLHNTLNSTLRGIELRAESANPNISFSFDQTIIQEIASGENHSVTLTIGSYKTYGNYEAIIYALVSEPEFNASKKFFINSIELGRHGDQEYNTRLSFVRDLLSTSPECIELSEQLDQARIAIESGNNQRAITILDTISENCRYLISISRMEPQLEQPTGFFSSIRNTPSQMLSYLGIIIVMNLLLVIMFAAFYSHPPRKGMPMPEKKENE